MSAVSSSSSSSHHNNGNNGNAAAYDSNGNDETKVKTEVMSDDDVPWGELVKRDKKLQKQKKRKADGSSDDDDYKPDKKVAKTPKKNGKKVKEEEEDDDEEVEYKPEKKKSKKRKQESSDEEEDDESDEDEDFKPQVKSEPVSDVDDDAGTTTSSSSSESDDDDEEKARKAAEEERKRRKAEKKERKRLEKEKESKVKKEEVESDEENHNEDDDEERKKKKRKSKSSTSDKSKPSTSKKDVKKESQPAKKKVKKEEDIEDIWEWWKEEKKPDGVKWNSLQHAGPLFAPPYVPLPGNVHFKYGGEVMKLSEDAEEIAQFYAGVLDHEYSTKDAFNANFLKDWRKSMTPKERERIVDLKKCDFRAIDVWQKEQREIRKAMTKEEKLKIKEEKEGEMKIYGIAVIDGHRQKVANFRIEPPGVFRGRGGHPKMGMLKKRIQPEDVIINCGKDSVVPKPPAGHKWKEVRHDNTVTWLCSWTESVLGQNKYIMLNPSSKIKGEKDHEKYETARRLKKKIGGIRERYTEDFKSKEMRIRQRATALYFIDKLALRAGNEKDVDEAADTVGCCSLRVEHIKLFDSAKLNEGDKKEKEHVVEFDFLGKDSIRYFNRVAVEKRVYKNVKLFMENKNPGDDLFDRLDTATLNEHLKSLMTGLTVKVFRTYNASITLQEQLIKLTNPADTVHAKILAYNRANRQVAILCNHQRAVSKGFDESMAKLEQKIKDKKKEVKEAEEALKGARGAEKEKAQKKYDQKKEQLKKLKISRTDKDENKQVALGTSKLNYLDPRITVAWAKKFEVPLEKVFTKTHREKFRWAIDMINSSDDEYVF